MPTEILAEFPEKLRFLFEASRYKVAYGGRGAGKSWGIARALLILGTQRKLRILCARETMRSIEESVHQVLTDQIRSLDLGDFYHIQLKNILGQNGTEFFFAGVRQSVENIKSYEDVDICWCEEAQSMSRRSLSILIPTIRKEGSEIWMSWNPEFETDEVYRMFVANEPPSGSQVVNINWRDNPWFGEVLKNEMEALRKRDPDEAEHVYEGSLRTTVVGAIYKKEIQAAEREGRFARVPYDPTKPVTTYWDIGPADTRIWLAQSFPMEFRIIDYIRGELESLSYYVKELQERPYSYAMHVLPWDGNAKELGSGKSIQEQLWSIFGRDRVRCARQLHVEDGIAAVRAILPKCWFDRDKCSEGIRGLRCYQYEYDKDLRTYKKNPLHDWACFTGDTKVLTRFGMCQIMDLPEDGEVLTPCGWKRYIGPRPTRTNAQLVEVRFGDGSTVRCTPDHLFLTESGWKSAESLTPTSAIQSSLTRSRSTLMAASTAGGLAMRTIRGAAKSCIATCGAWLSEIFPQSATYITETVTQLTINSPIWSVCPGESITASRMGEIAVSTPKREKERQIGTGRTLVGYGIAAMQKDLRHGRNGSALVKTALSAAKSLWGWLGKVILKSTVPHYANPLRVVSVTHLAEREDTYCIYVEDGHWFSLANGAIVHNSHDADAFRTLAVTIREAQIPKVIEKTSYHRTGATWA